MPTPGPRDLITDVPGILIGNADDPALRSGVTVLLPERPVAAAVDIRGGGPGTRETAALASTGVVGGIHALVFSGGSAFGLDAATGVQSLLRERGAGFAVGAVRVPIVPQAILFDLLNGGDTDWGRHPPYRDLAYRAAGAAAEEFALGTAGAGTGATVARFRDGQRLKGGLGSASLITQTGHRIGALAAVNAAGTVTIADSPHFWAAPLECGAEFGGLGWPAHWPAEARRPVFKAGPGQSTTLGVIATDAALGKAELQRLAIMAQTGLARAIYPVHTPLDGDIVFALSTGAHALADPVWDLARLGAHAADTLARAVARGVYEATAFPGVPHGPPCYRDLFAKP